MSPRSLRPGLPGVRTGTSVSGVTEESIIAEIYTHYCGLAHKALLQCIQRSLELLYHCVCPPEMIRDVDERYDNGIYQMSFFAWFDQFSFEKLNRNTHMRWDYVPVFLQKRYNSLETKPF